MPRSLFCLLLVALVCPSLQAQKVRPEETPAQLEALATKGDADKQFELGLRLITGEGVKKDEAEGVKWLEKAANQNHLRAQFIMGSLHEDGTGVQKNETKAVEWYRRSAMNGFAPAQFAYAMALDLGRGTKQNTEEANEWLERAADQNHAQAQTALASKLEHGAGGLSASPTRAAQLYLRAAQQDFVQAMSRLANLYYTGAGVPLDYRRAYAWYLRAARSEDPWSANNLAWFLATCPDESLHHGDLAVQHASRALRLMDEAGQDQRHEMLDTKAACLARNGEYLAAILWQKRAMTLLDEDKELTAEERTKLKDEFTQRLKLYQQESPYLEKEPKSEKTYPPLPQDTILQEEELPKAQKPAPKKKTTKGKGTVV